jgi:hypothetical protein
MPATQYRLLWEAVGSGKPPTSTLSQLKENSSRVSDTVEEICGAISRKGQLLN